MMDIGRLWNPETGDYAETKEEWREAMAGSERLAFLRAGIASRGINPDLTPSEASEYQAQFLAPLWEELARFDGRSYQARTASGEIARFDVDA